MFQGPTTSSTSKTSHNKSEGAPIIFFMDIFESESYLNPITPIPSRVDKIFLAQSCGFPLPTQNPIVQIDEQHYSFNFEIIYRKLLENLLYYAKQVSERIGQGLSFKQIEIWWDNTRRYIPMIRNYQEDLDYGFRLYLEALKWYKHGTNEQEALLKYTNSLLYYFNSKIDYNSIEFQIKNKPEYQKMFREKGNYKYPNVVKYDIYDVLNKNFKRKIFIPIFVYDDIIECLLYNRQILELRMNPSLSAKDLGMNEDVDLEKKYKEAKEAQLYSFDQILQEKYIVKTEDTKPQPINIANFETFVRNQDLQEIFDQLEDKEMAKLLDD